MIESLALEAAQHWGGHSPRLIRNRENAVFEISLPSGPAALRLHRMGYQSDAAIWSELWWCDALAAAGLPISTPILSQSGALLELVPGTPLDVPLYWQVAQQPLPELERLTRSVVAAAGQALL